MYVVLIEEYDSYEESIKCKVAGVYSTNEDATQIATQIKREVRHNNGTTWGYNAKVKKIELDAPPPKKFLQAGGRKKKTKKQTKTKIDKKSAEEIRKLAKNKGLRVTKKDRSGYYTKKQLIAKLKRSKR